MHVLDIDLDFFLSKVATYVYGEDRLLESDGYYPWDEERVRSFLENNCGLDKNNPIKGAKFVQHHEVFIYWRKLILEGKLETPIEVVHVDAHADLGLGDASWKYIIGDILHKPINERYFPEIGGWSGLNEGNFLAFALACQWIKNLVYVYHPDAGDDTIHFYCKDFDENSGYLEMPKYDSHLLSNPYFYKEHKPKSFEPIVPYKLIEGVNFYSDEKFSYAFLTQSPKYTPRSSDGLIPVILEYIDIIETG